MRTIVKVILFPVSLVLSSVLLPCKFMCLFGTTVLSLISYVIFIVATLTMLFFGEIGEGVRMMFLAFLISPYGIPMVASGMIGVIDGISKRMRLI